MDLNLKDRVLIVAGGSWPFLQATAACLVADGARVVLAAGDARELESAANQADISAAVCVVPSKDSPVVPERLVAAALDKWGRLDGALIGVAPSPKGNALEVTDTEWSAAFQSVFLDAVGMIRGISRSLASGGSVALVLSPNESEPLAPQTVTTGIEAALASVSMQLAVELGPQRHPRQRAGSWPDPGARCGSAGLSESGKTLRGVAEGNSVRARRGQPAGDRPAPAGPVPLRPASASTTSPQMSQRTVAAVPAA